MDLKGCIQAFGLGIYDSLRGFKTLFYIDKELNARKLARLSPTKTNIPLRKKTGIDSKEASSTRPLKEHEQSKAWPRTVQCCLLNGGIFIVSMQCFYYGFLPAAAFIVNTLLGENSFGGRMVLSWLTPAITYIFQAIWVVPLFLLSKVINSLWFQDIATAAYQYAGGRPQGMQSISIFLADIVFSIVLQSVFLIQASLVGYIPIYGLAQVLSFIHMCMLYSLYAFEYKWYHMAWELHKRLAYIEANWPYFIGFGLPLAIITGFCESWFICGALFSMCFPIFIISANEANPVTGVCDFPLRLFAPVVLLSNKLLVTTVRRTRTTIPAPKPSRR